MNLLWCLSVFVLGFVASAGQALLLRSLLATFHGNELTLGIGLALWMIGTALGSLAAVKGWFGFRGKRSLGMAFLSGAAAIPAAVALGRVIGTAAGAHRGELAPLGTAALGGAMLFLPVTAVLGAAFTLACRAAVRGAVHAARAVGRTYMLDAAGAALGGVTFAFVLVALCGPLQTAMFLSAACLGVGVALLGAPRAALCAACVGVLLASSGIPAALDDRLLSISWPGYDVLASKDTAFQSLVVARREDQVSLFSNGSHVASFPQFEGPELLACWGKRHRGSQGDSASQGGSTR
jgi:hypothetical protein